MTAEPTGVPAPAVQPWRAAWIAFVAASDPGRDLSALAEGDDVDPQWRDAWTAAARAATREAVKQAVAASYRQVAAFVISDIDDREEALSIARQVETVDGEEICCPCCQEVECDDGCPLEPVRTGAA